jgi:hypothetical protein
MDGWVNRWTDEKIHGHAICIDALPATAVFTQFSSTENVAKGVYGPQYVDT